MLLKSYQQKLQHLKLRKQLNKLIYFKKMTEKTSTEIAEIFTNAGDSVTEIGVAKTDLETTDEYKERIKRNVEHLEIIKGYKKEDETTSIWTSESFTAIDAAIVAGKKLY